jgi:hypothetical protein
MGFEVGGQICRWLHSLMGGINEFSVHIYLVYEVIFEAVLCILPYLKLWWE